MAWYNPMDYLSGALGKGSAAAGRAGVGDLNPFATGRGKEFKQVDPEGNLSGQAGKAGAFGDVGESGFGRRGEQADQTADYLGRVMRGEESVSAEQLRQGLAQNQAAQMSMAAGARPGNSAMAARNASMQAGRLGAGLSGQQAMAGIAERQAAAGQLGRLQSALRGQDLQAALGGRGQAIGGYGALENARTQRFGAMLGVPTPGEQILGWLGGTATMGAMK